MKSKKTLIKSIITKVNEFVIKKSDPSIAITKLERFCRNHLILVSDNFDQYAENERRHSNIKSLAVTLSRLVQLVYLFKYIIPALLPMNGVKTYMVEATYMLGDPRIISAMMFMCLLTVSSIAIYIQYAERNNKLFVLLFFSQLKRNVFPIKLRNRSKFGLKINLMTEYLLKYFYNSLFIPISMVFIVPLIIVYLKSDSHLLLPLVLFWSLVTILWSFFFYSICAFFICITYIVTLFLKSKFDEIHQDMQRSINIRQLRKSIVEHDQICLLVVKFDKYFSVILFIIYYSGTPAVQLIAYVSHHNDTILLFRFVAASVSIGFATLLFLLNYQSALVQKSAIKPYQTIFSVIAKHKLSYRQMLTVENFLCRLSGPDIGFHCLNMFPMNNYEFYQYVSVAMTNYFLIMNNL